MRIGIIGAMPQEIDRIEMDFAAERIERVAGRSYHIGKFAGAGCVLVFSRWGKVASASTATTLIERFAVDHVIFTGVAGAVSSALNVGDVVVADRLLQHDFDVSSVGKNATEMFAKFEIPFLGISYFPVDARLVELAEQAANDYLASNELQTPLLKSTANVYIGTIASGDQFIGHPDRLEELRSAIPDLLCVEMEGAAVAQVCYEYGIPYAVIRTISDKADHSAAMDFITFIQEIAQHYSHGILKRLIPAIKNL